jgi:Protein of unknown function (DUF2809)
VLNGTPDQPMRTRRLGAATITRACPCLLIIVCGLALRKFGPVLGLPSALVKYGGSMLWGTMVFFLVAIAAPGQPRWRIALISALLAAGVELFRLVHAPWLDDFRLTTTGALLLGRVYSRWNMLAYGVGIMLGVILDRLARSAFATTRPSARHPLHSAS